MRKKFRLVNYTELIDFSDIDLTVKEAVVAKCHECCAFDASEAKHCECKTCPLYTFNKKWYKIPRKVDEEAERERGLKRAEFLKGLRKSSGCL